MILPSPTSFAPSARLHVRILALGALLLLLPLPATGPAHAAKVLALVNDMPVTDFDVSQRLKLNAIIGGPRSRKGAFRSLVNAAVLETEARKAGIAVPEQVVDKTIADMAKNMGGMARLKALLRKRGVRMGALRTYVRSTILFRSFARKMGRKLSVKVDEKEVERRYRKIINDPRLKPVTIYTLRQVDLPVENVAPAMRGQLLYARAVEARQIMQRYRGCSTLRKATSGIFNVKISRPVQADPKRLPKPLRKAISLAGTKRLIGPIRTRRGIQLIAYCGRRTITPPRPKREQVAQMVKAEAFNRQVEKVMRELRKKAYIEYKDSKLRLR